MEQIGMPALEWGESRERSDLHRSILSMDHEQLAKTLENLRNSPQTKLGERATTYLELMVEAECLIRGIIDERKSVVRVEKVSLNGKATQSILQEWYLHGPDHSGSGAKNWREIIKRIILNGRLREGWTDYVKSVPESVWQELGYSFPVTIRWTADAAGKTLHTSEAILAYFGEKRPQELLSLMAVKPRGPGKPSNPGITRDRATLSEHRKRIRSEVTARDEAYAAHMRKWYHEGYVDPITGETITGKALLLAFVRSGRFNEQLVRYFRSLPMETIRTLGFVPRKSLETNYRLLGILQDGMTIVNLLAALGEENAELIAAEMPAQKIRNALSTEEYTEKIRTWYYNGYEDDSGNIIRGKDVLIRCMTEKGSYDTNFRAYAQSLSTTETQRIGCKLHRKIENVLLNAGFSGKGNIEDFLRFIGEPDVPSVLSNQKRKLRANAGMIEPVTQTIENHMTPQADEGVVHVIHTNELEPRYLVYVGETIPTEFRYAMRAIFRRVKRAVSELVELEEYSIGMRTNGKEYDIVFLNRMVEQRMREVRNLVLEAVDEANVSVEAMANSAKPKNRDKVTYMPFGVHFHKESVWQA